MTFKEYLANNGKTKLGLFDVDITKDDCIYTKVSETVFGGREVKEIELCIDVHGIHCTYKCYADSGYCYTVDQHGNMKNPTVFMFVDTVLVL